MYRISEATILDFVGFMFTESAQNWLGCYQKGDKLVVHTNVRISEDTYEGNDIDIENTRNKFLEWAAVFGAEIWSSGWWNEGPPFQEFSVPVAVFEPYAETNEAVEEFLCLAVGDWDGNRSD